MENDLIAVQKERNDRIFLKRRSPEKSNMK